tara:strand:+ start:1703 stop:1921 length:219 start_codon:yes stop_codon:yes gene_type:complete
MITYTIINKEDASEIDFSQVLETSEGALRYSVDGTKIVLKFEGETPAFLVGLQQYNHSEILSIMNSPEWNND